MNAEERFRRKMTVLNYGRQREQDRDECLAEVITSLAGTSHEELVRRAGGSIESHRIVKNGRTYTVDLAAYADSEPPATLRLIFSVDDAGLYLTEPKTTTRFVTPGEKLAF